MRQQNSNGRIHDAYTRRPIHAGRIHDDKDLIGYNTHLVSMILGRYEKLLLTVNPENTVIIATEPVVLMGLKRRLR